MGYFLMEHQINLLRTLYDQGLSDSAIHRKSGISEVAIARWRRLRGLESNYVKKVGMPAPYTRANFDHCFNHREKMKELFEELGVSSRKELLAWCAEMEARKLWEQRFAMQVAAKELNIEII